MSNEQHKKYIAIFDIDGTVFRSALMTQLHLALVREGIFPKKTNEIIKPKLQAWLDRRGSYRVYIDTMVKVFKDNIIGKKQSDILRVSHKVIEEQKNRVYTYTTNLIKKIRKTHLLVAISGSSIEIVREFNKYWKFDHVYGEILEVEDGVYTGKIVVEPILDKKVLVEAFIDAHHLSLKGSIGVGDTESDISFLEIVAEPICFNPNSHLYVVAKKKGWKVVVERKDVIYEL